MPLFVHLAAATSRSPPASSSHVQGLGLAHFPASVQPLRRLSA